MNALASKSALVAAKPVAARRQPRAQVQVLAQEKKQQGSSQRREVFAGLLATAAVVALPKPAQAEERSATLIAKLCASNPTSKACLDASAKR